MAETLSEQSKSRKFKFLLWAVIVVGLGVVIYVLVGGEKLIIRSGDAYQAVFLDNNQVYFGKLKEVNDDWWSLTDIYYLRAGTVQNADTNQAENQIDLIKLGGELHAPQDEMIINKDRVIFYEDVGAGSEIVKLIRKHRGQ